MKPLRLPVKLAFLALCCVPFVAPAQWQMAESPLKTRWADDVSPANPLPEYPRPQMVRKDWQNLNGLWDYAITGSEASRPAAFDGQILVPYPVESALSGVKRMLYETNRLWYRRSFEIARSWESKRVILHFGAVDWDTVVWVNGKEIGRHRGGYGAFSFDITDALRSREAQEVVVAVTDPTDKGYQPRGKQVLRPQGIFYTPCSGIWQTVWLEAVSGAHIKGLRITPDVDNNSVRVMADTVIPLGAYEVEVNVSDFRGRVGTAKVLPGKEAVIKIKEPRLWTPDRPALYDLTVSLKLGSRTLDRVDSYFGMRKVSLGKDAKGFTRILLNNQPLFQNGFLDQGFWPDGIYTAPTDKALRFDIEMTKKMGFNLARKHVKVEPARWYYWCDKLGLLVWQDMPSGDSFIRGEMPDIQRRPESGQNFERELKALVDGLYNHPSIVMWVPYNEGWGQWDTARIVDLIKAWDPTRLVNNASGWTDRGVGDVNDMHRYPGPGSPKPEDKRAVVLGEFGGLGFPMKGHTWQSERNWGYRTYTNAEALTTAYLNLAQRLWPLIESHGLSAAVYTQTTDVEGEVNGLMTYDREVVKIDLAKLAAWNQGHLPPAPKITDLLPSAQTERGNWKYTTTSPAADWFQPGFNDSSWKTGPAGFGTQGTPGGTVRTTWDTSDIWLRRSFDAPGQAGGELKLVIHHDEDAEVYLNGVKAASLSGFIGDYQTVDITPEAAAALKPAGNIIAVHCRQTRGGQYIDAGLVRIQKP
jgi:hypothetical protein